MRRIKLNRPPPVSSETVKEIVSDNTVVDSRSSSTQHVTTQSEAGDVSAVDISANVEKCSSDVRLVTGKDVVTVQEDVRRAVKKRRTVVRDASKEHSSAASANVLQGSSDVLVASDSTLKHPKKKLFGNVTEIDTELSLSGTGSDDKQSSYAEQHVVASSDSVTPDCQNAVSITHRKRKTSKKSYTAVSKTPLLQSVSACDVSSKGNRHSSFCDNSGLPHSSQETVARTEHQQSGLAVNQKLSGSLLDDVLKGFLVKKLAVIESERKVTDVNCKDERVEAVGHNEPKDFSSLSKSRRRKRSREIDEQRRDLGYLPKKLRDRDRTLHHYDVEHTEPLRYAGYMKSHLDDDAHQGHHRLPPHLVHGFTGAEDVTKRDFGTDVSSFRRGRRKLGHSGRHSFYAKRHLLSLDEKNRHMEHRHQSYHLPQLQRNQFNEQKNFDCIEQIRHFVSHIGHNFSQDRAPLEMCYENSAPETHGRERRKSGSSSSHHHHRKKQKTAKHASEEKMCLHKCVKRSSDKRRMQTVTNVQEAKLTSKKREKHKHRHHHSKGVLPDVHVDSQKPDINAALCHVEPKDEGDTFNKSRSLSPLGVHTKHHKKHKKKHSKKTASQISADDASLLPENSSSQFDKASRDEDFIPMKVQKNEDGDSISSNALHKLNVLNTSGVEQGQTSSKSAVGHPSKFLKISGKRPKRRMHVSDANPSAEVQVSSEEDHRSNISVEEHPVRAAVEDQFQAVKDTENNHVTTEGTIAAVVAVGRDYSGHTDTSRDVSTLASFTASEQANSCSDAGDGRVLQTTTVTSDQVVSEEVRDTKHVCSTDEVIMASPISTMAANDNLTEPSTNTNESMLQLGETEHGETMEETNDVTKELSTRKDDVPTSKIVSSDNTSCTVNAEELKSYSEECANGEVFKSQLSGSDVVSEFLPNIEPDAVQEKTFTKGQSEETEKIESEEVRPASEEDDNNTDRHSASVCDIIAPTKPCLLQLSEKAGIDASASCGIASGEGSSAAKMDSSAENVQSCDADEKVDGNHSVAPSNLMGPPLALPPSLAFKKPLPLKMSLRITDSSADFISSGAKNNDRKARSVENREEGNQVAFDTDCLLIFCLATCCTY